MTTAHHLTPPTARFAALARNLLQEKRRVMDYEECRPEEALEQARTSLVWHHRLDAIAKGSILGIGAGGLIFSGMGVAAVFAGVACAAFGIKVARDAINCAQDVDRAYALYRNMTPAAFNQYLSSAPKAG